MRLTAIVPFAILGALAPSGPALHAQIAADTGWHVARRFELGGDGGWDYLAVDTATGRVFIVRSDRVMVIDASSGRVLGEIPGLHGGHGVTFDPGTGHGFITSGADSTVTVFDMTSLAPLGTVGVGVDDDALLRDPKSGRIVTFDGDANTASVIDPRTSSRVGVIALGGKPEAGIATSDRIFVNIEDRAEIVELDAQRLAVVRRWSIAPCTAPTGLAVDSAHDRLFSVCRNRMMVVSDATAGRVVATVPIGGGVDGVVYDATRGDALSSNGEGSITVVHEDGPDAYRVTATVPTMPGARTIALDPMTHRVYTVSARFGPPPTAASAEARRRRPPVIPGSFTLLVLER